MPHVQLVELATDQPPAVESGYIPKRRIVCEQESYGDSSPLRNVSEYYTACVLSPLLTCWGAVANIATAIATIM